MKPSLFESVPNFRFDLSSLEAQQKLNRLREQSCAELPQQIRSKVNVLTLFKEIKQTLLYRSIQSMPKGVLHHVHFQCCDDQQFYTQHVVDDPILYLSQNLDSFQIGTKEEARNQGWVSMDKAAQKFGSKLALIKHLASLTMLDQSQIKQGLKKGSSFIWQIFQKKIANFFPIVWTKHLSKKYAVYVFKKMIKNGYSRVQFRILPVPIKQYDQEGHMIKQHKLQGYFQVLEESYQEVQKEFPFFSVGFILNGLKFLPPEQNQQILFQAFQQQWDKVIGIDFVQQEDPHGSLQPFDKIAVNVLEKFGKDKYKKVYHAGETKNHLNNNIQIAIQAGSVRIGHGINVLQHPQIIQDCKNKGICFEQCPVSNLILGYVSDPRCAPTQLLVGLGLPVTINSDDPGRFGLQDSTMDFFITLVNTNWQLKHLKLVGIYSINHSICSERQKQILVQKFEQSWSRWIEYFLAL